MFVRYLQPSERTDVGLAAIVGMRASSACDPEAAACMLDVLVTEPASMLEHVSSLQLACLGLKASEGLFPAAAGLPSADTL